VEGDHGVIIAHRTPPARARSGGTSVTGRRTREGEGPLPLDPDAARILHRLQATGGPPLEWLAPAEARVAGTALADLSPKDTMQVASVDRHVLGGVPCLVVAPRCPPPWPVLVWFHGGGWVLGTAEKTLHTPLDLAAAAGCAVVSAGYRLAPEHPFPAAVRDALAVTRAVLETGAVPGADPSRVAVGGDSSGGTLAAVAALRVRGLVHQLLAYPVVDATMAHPSYATMGEGYLLTASTMRWFLGLYLAGHDPDDPDASPLAAPDHLLRGACPAHLVLAGHDPLRDEGEAYAARLAAAGVAVEVSRYEGQMHGFLTMGAVIPTGAAALADAAARLRRAFDRGPRAHARSG
jgi:acetyl esterase